MNLIQHFVGGKLIAGSSNKKGKVFNPATGDQQSEVILANTSDLDEAVSIAKRACRDSLQRKDTETAY